MLPTCQAHRIRWNLLKKSRLLSKHELSLTAVSAVCDTKSTTMRGELVLSSGGSQVLSAESFRCGHQLGITIEHHVAPLSP